MAARQKGMSDALILVREQTDRRIIFVITSTSNQQMKHILQLQKKSKTRYEQRVFVVEGPKMAFEAPKGWVEKLYVSESFYKDAGNAARLTEYDYEVVSDSVLKAVSDTQTPQGILALVKMPTYSLEEFLTQIENTDGKMERSCTGNDVEGMNRNVPHLLILESIQDPGNLGTMLRTGEGAGISGIIMNKTTVDVFNPKTIRSTMGSIYRVPVFVTEDLHGTIGDLQKLGIHVYAAHLKGTNSYDVPDYTKGTAFLIGNEGNGLTDETADLADEYIRIPMEGSVESLNAAIAATLLMYEVHRQRRRL